MDIFLEERGSDFQCRKQKIASRSRFWTYPHRGSFPMDPYPRKPDLSQESRVGIFLGFSRKHRKISILFGLWKKIILFFSYLAKKKENFNQCIRAPCLINAFCTFLISTLETSSFVWIEVAAATPAPWPLTAQHIIFRTAA